MKIETPLVLEIATLAFSLYIFPLFLLNFLGITISIPASFFAQDLRLFISVEKNPTFSLAFYCSFPPSFSRASPAFFLSWSTGMTDYYSKKSGQLHIQIPVFGDWDNADQLPITQYFASAAQAGLIRYSSSSGECVPTGGRRESYGVDHNKNGPTNSHPTKRAKATSQQISNVGKRQQGKAFYAAEPPLKVYNNHHSSPPKPPKPVDEDLYKIPADQLKKHRSKRNKVLRVLSRCLIPACHS